ncbi:retinol-binding protein pinta-like [Leptidea sinapis]|uniref:retinol-binding protein pinta-like n=1 Tax=Leptidea sinapis TaxID=189913 RepID=UPI00212EEAC9|nr:retinol-binding protein pinta-like [Leptidea sinapis]XP_050675534.1 retinol-binding protein pinta-like [Leptidea sinapis]XP_050675536.1 retinol-binding protein pinta-like [Leptidea sinapis]
MTIRPLSGPLQEKAIKELFEDPERVESDIAAIRTWLQKQPHLESANPSDQRIVSFLRGNKYSLERTKEKLDMSYTLRSLVPEIFQNRDPLDPKIQRILAKGTFLPLSKCAKEDGPRPVLVRFTSEIGPDVTMADIMKINFMIIDLLIEEDDNFVIAGEEVISDGKDLGFVLMSQFTPALAKKTVTSFEKALPLRMKAVHLLNTPPGFETAYSLLKTFISEKLRNRFHVHNKNFAALYEKFPQEMLPEEYGGRNGSIQELTDYWKGKVESRRDWFLEEDKARSNEYLRPGKPKTTSSLFGVEGSFRKLDVD